jgi:class 3 adenylate cyclase
VTRGGRIIGDVRDLPHGTVTFLFSDVEGSTRLLDELGADRYSRALAEQRRIVREACTRFGGIEVDTQGDAFFIAFPTAPGAAEAAQAISEELASGPIRVRVGLHTGTPLVTDEGYVGADVHRAARIAASGHGGQVLVSASTAGLVNLELRDLGEHRFKDLAAPERVFQLGDGGFPPLRSLRNVRLPVPPTPFLGRARELEQVAE